MKNRASRLLKRIFCSLALLIAPVTPALLTPLVPTTAWAAGKPVSDDFLVDTIRQKLAADTVVKGGAIDVEVKDGAAVLKGKVEEERQKSRAEKIAKSVRGVKSVSNQIEVGRPDLPQ